MLHLGSIGLSYATNWERSAIQDRILIWLQPYLIGGNWYHEMLPVEWISDSTKSKSVRLTVQSADRPGKWDSVLDASSAGTKSGRTQPFLHILSNLAIGEDTQGLTRVLSSIINHIETNASRDTDKILRIRLERTGTQEEADESDSVLYEAALARFPSGEFGFVPKVEPHRTVRALESTNATPK